MREVKEKYFVVALLILCGSLVLTGQGALKLTRKVNCQGKAKEPHRMWARTPPRREIAQRVRMTRYARMAKGHPKGFGKWKA